MKVPYLRGRKGRSDSQTKAAHPPKRQQQLPPAEAGKITRKYQPEQADIIERLQTILAEVDSMALPTGQLGGEFLDALKLVERISEKVFAKARELLRREPGAISNWHVNDVPMRTLSHDTAKVFDALAEADGSLTAEEFLEACSTNLTKIRKLLEERNPLWTPGDIEHELNRILANQISYEMVARLSRVKDRLSLEKP